MDERAVRRVVDRLIQNDRDEEAWIELVGLVHPSPPPERLCSRCGVPESDTEWGSLIDARVIVAEGEEGFADIIQLLCEDCFGPIQKGLLDLGFADHRHGGINFLEDTKCPGERSSGVCPTPSEYGTHVVGQVKDV